jgi:hypothetical protein
MFRKSSFNTATSSDARLTRHVNANFREEVSVVPVTDKQGIPLMPCSEKRARKLLEKGQAKAKWKNQIFYIELLNNPSDRKYQDITIGIDPGSKREGITVTTDKKVVLNITCEAVSTVKDSVGTRRSLRRSRRNRNAPYRKCRFNRTTGAIPPSSKARWNQKLRLLTLIEKIIPITVVNVEDIAAVTKKGARRWNKNFSPLEVGKRYFRHGIEAKGLRLQETKGFETKAQRDLRCFSKTKEKLKNVWEAHCVDSHALCEISTGTEIEPFKGMYIFENFCFSRRQLHLQNFSKGGLRKEYGGTVSLSIPRGALVRHPKFGLNHVGGSSKGRISLHDTTGKRVTQSAKKEDLKILTINKWRARLLP